MKAVKLSDARQALVRTRVLEGVAAVLGRGDELTFANVARTAGVPERTVYRHFPTREALLADVYDWANERIGFQGERPKDAEGVAKLVRRLFPGFDEIAPVIRELLVAPEGRLARLSQNPSRQRAMLAVVEHEAPALDRRSARRVAAVLQLLTSAMSWQALREYWNIDGAEAAEASVLAMELIFEGIRAHGSGTAETKQRARGTKRRAGAASGKRLRRSKETTT